MTLLFCDTREEDQDTYLFRDLAAQNIGAPLVIVADGRNIWDVFKDERMLGNTRADPCSKILKREAAEHYVREHFDPADTVRIIGYGPEEPERFRKFQARMDWLGWNCAAPLCWEKPMFAAEVKELAKREGLPENRLYRLGFEHSNCGGLCIKAGQRQFRHALEVLPAVFDRWEREEEQMRAYLGKNVAILRDRRGGSTRPLTLREFRERYQASGQFDLFDSGEGPCGCFTED